MTTFPILLIKTYNKNYITEIFSDHVQEDKDDDQLPLFEISMLLKTFEQNIYHTLNLSHEIFAERTRHKGPLKVKTL